MSRDDTPPATERSNPRCRDLEQKSTAELLALYHDEMRRVPDALESALPALAGVIDAVADAWMSGGRLLYAGAGTSGRLGVLDASEMAPTFGVSPDMVQAVIAGGDAALRRSVEAAEDDTVAAVADAQRLGPSAKDVVVGIAASGNTPYVLALLHEARRAGAATVLLCCADPAPGSLPPETRVVRLETDPEFITGSTRLAAGTATKLALNAITTLAMIRCGKVRDHLMIDVRPTNAKLRARAIRIVSTLASCPPAEAAQQLERAGWNIRAALDI